MNDNISFWGAIRKTVLIAALMTYNKNAFQSSEVRRVFLRETSYGLSCSSGVYSSLATEPNRGQASHPG